MEFKHLIETYPLILIAGLLIIGVSFAYLIWHLVFLGIFPAKKAIESKLAEKSLLYTPELGFTLADGGEELKDKKEDKDEKKGVS